MTDLFRKSYDGNRVIALRVEPEQICALECIDITITPKPTAQVELEICLCRKDTDPQRIFCACPADNPEDDTIYAHCYRPSHTMRFRRGDYLTISYTNPNNREWSVVAEFVNGDI